MQKRKAALLVACAGAYVALLGCAAILGVTDVPDASDASSQDGPAAQDVAADAPSGSTDGGEDSGPACPVLVNGTYTEHYTSAEGGCTVPADSTFTIPGDAGPDSGDSGCIITPIDAGCTVDDEYECNASGGYQVTGMGMLTIASDGKSAVGSSQATTHSPDGGIFAYCALTYTQTLDP